MSANLRNWLVQLYPHSWRERYAEEFEMLLEEGLDSPLDVVDIFLGAVDARLQFPFELNWMTVNMDNRLRTSILMVFAAYIGFIVGGMSLYGLADDSPLADLMKSGANPVLSGAWVAIELGSAITLLAVILGGLPLALTIMRRAFDHSRKNFRWLLVPVLAFLALVVYAAFMALVLFQRLPIPGVVPVVSPEDFPLGNRLLIGGFMLLFVLGAIASTIAVWKAALNTDDENSGLEIPGFEAPLKPYKFAFVPSVIAAFGMLWMLLATLAWGWLAHAAVPHVFSENWGLLLSNTTFSFAITIAIMVVSTAAAFLGVSRGHSSRKLL